MAITTIQGLQRYLKRNSYFSSKTIHSVLVALGYPPRQSTQKDFKELSGVLKDCSKYGANAGFSGFIYYRENINFFKKHRQDIIFNLLNTASNCGDNAIIFVQELACYHNFNKPTDAVVIQALAASGQYYVECNFLYNMFVWFTLEKIANTWNRYLEENPAIAEKLAA